MYRSSNIQDFGTLLRMLGEDSKMLDIVQDMACSVAVNGYDTNIVLMMTFILRY